MKEIIFYAFLACSSVFLFGYSIHMLVGGMVSKETEITLITIGCVIAIGVIGYMAWDVVQHRRKR